MALKSETQQQRVLLSEVQQELASKANRAKSRELEEQEQQRRSSRSLFRPPTVDAALKDVQVQLLHHVNGRLVDKQAEEERTRRMQRESQHDAMAELMSRLSRRKARQAEEAERMRRILKVIKFETGRHDSRNVNRPRAATFANGTSSSTVLPVREVPTPWRQIHSDILRAVHAREADTAAEHERMERIAHENLHAVMSQLVHEQHGMRARQLALNEQQRLVQQERKHGMQQQLCSYVQYLCNKHEMELERVERVQRDLLANALEQLLRSQNQKKADHLADAEQKERVGLEGLASSTLHATTHKPNNIRWQEFHQHQQQQQQLSDMKTDTMQELVRHVHQQQADQSADQEQQERILRNVFSRALDDLQRGYTLRRVVLPLCEQEQLERSHAHRMHDVLNNQLVPRVCARQADIACDIEQQRRIVAEYQMPAVCDDIRRTVAQARAGVLMNREQQERTDRNLHYERLLPVRRQLHSRFADDMVSAECRAEQQEKQRNGDIVQAFESVLEELQHAVHAKQADMLADEERKEHMFRAAMDQCVQQLQRRADTLAADSDADMERARRVHRDGMLGVCDQLTARREAQHTRTMEARERALSHVQAVHALAMEGVMRCVEKQRAERMSFEEQVHARQQLVFDSVICQLKQRSSVRAAEQQAAIARIECAETHKHALDVDLRLYVHRPLMQQLHADLSRAVPAKVEAGIVPDVARGRLDNVHSELVSVTHRRFVQQSARALLQELEQRRRFDLAMEQVLSFAVRADVLAAEKEEQVKRTCEHVLFFALQDLVRSVNAKRADAAMSLEQAQRMAVEHMQREVLPALVSKHNRNTARVLAMQEQRARIASLADDGVEELPLMPTAFPPQVRQELVRRVAAKRADMAMDDAQQQRTCEHVMFFALQDLVRSVNAKRADAAMNLEQAQRMAVEHMQREVLPALVSKHNRNTARVLAMQEQQRMVVMDVHRRAMDLMRSVHARRLCAQLSRCEQQRQQEEDAQNRPYTVLHCILHDITAKAARQEAARASALEQARLVHRDAWAHVMDGVASRASLARVVADEEDERARRVHADRFKDALEDVVRRVNGRWASLLSQREQLRRVSNPPPPAHLHALSLTMSSVHRQLCSVVALRKAAAAQVAREKQRIWQQKWSNVMEGMVRQANLFYVHRLEEQARREALEEQAHITPAQEHMHNELLTELQIRQAMIPAASMPSSAAMLAF